MSDCSFHPDRAAVAECVACARPVCEVCRREVRAASYCEECLAARLATPAAVPSPGRHRSFRLTGSPLPNPTLAAFFGVIPGVGACYNAQYEKALLHVLMLPMLVAMAESEDIFGFLIPVYLGYMIVDAYKTAIARVQGLSAPDYLGLRTLFGSSEKPISAAFGLDTAGGAAAPAGTESGAPPMGAIVLIVLGVVLLFGNLGWIPRQPFGTYWPLVVVVIGLLQGRRRLRAAACACLRCRANELLAPALLVTFGILMVIGNLHWLSFGRTWPLMLVVLGAVRVLQSTAPTAGHAHSPSPDVSAPEVTHE